MNINTINPYIRLATESILPKDFYMKQRVLFDFELIYVERGSFVLWYGGREFGAKEGDIILLHPNVRHSIKSNGDEISQPHIHFSLKYSPESSATPISFKDSSDFTESERQLIEHDPFAFYTSPFVKCEDKSEFLEIFYRIVCDKSDKNQIKKRGLLLEILDIIIGENFQNALSSNEDGGYSLAHHIKDFIKSESAHKMSLDDFERQFGYNKYHIEKLFKKQFGVGLIQYRNKIRLLSARELLKTKRVTEVAEIVGYQSIYSFSRAYKNHFGKSPEKAKNG